MGEQTARLFNDLKDFNEYSRHVKRAGYRDFRNPYCSCFPRSSSRISTARRSVLSIG